MLLAAVWRVQVDRYSLFDLRYSLSTVYRLQTTAIVISHSLQSTAIVLSRQSTVFRRRKRSRSTEFLRTHTHLGGFRGLPGLPGFRGRLFFRFVFWSSKIVSKISLSRLFWGPEMESNSMKDWSKTDLEIKLRFLIDFWSLGSRKWRPRAPVILLKSLVFLHQNEFALFRQETVFVSMWVPTRFHFGTLLDPKWRKHRSRTRIKKQSMFR